MSKAYLAAFAVVAAVAATSADYVNHSRVAGSGPGRFPAADYVATIPLRFRSEDVPRTVAAEARGDAAPAPEVTVTRKAISTNCDAAGGVKRCRIGRD